MHVVPPRSRGLVSCLPYFALTPSLSLSPPTMASHGAFWKYFAAFDVTAEVFIPSQQAIIPNGGVSFLKVIGDDMWVAGSVSSMP